MNKPLQWFRGSGSLFVLLALGVQLTSCATLAAYLFDETSQAPPPTTIFVTRPAPVPVQVPPLKPLLKSRTPLTAGPYSLTPFERKALREIFGPPVVRWVERHIRVGRDSDFWGSTEDCAAFFKPEDKSIVLRLEQNQIDAQRFANLIHEATHFWEFTQYRRFVPVPVTKANLQLVYWIPPTWVGLNIEQEAEMVSLYAILTYLFTRSDQSWNQYGTRYTRADLPRIEEYMIREMYF